MPSIEELAEVGLVINSAYKFELAFEDVRGAWEKYIESWSQEWKRLQGSHSQDQHKNTQLPISEDLYFATAFLFTRMTVFWDRDQAVNGKNKENEKIGIIFFLRNYTEHVGTLRGHIFSGSLKTKVDPLEEKTGIDIILEELLTHDRTFQKNKQNRKKLENFRVQNPGLGGCNISLELGREFRRILGRYPRCSSLAKEAAEKALEDIWWKYPTASENPSDVLRVIQNNNAKRTDLQKINQGYVDDAQLNLVVLNT